MSGLDCATSPIHGTALPLTMDAAASLERASQLSPPDHALHIQEVVFRPRAGFACDLGEAEAMAVEEGECWYYFSKLVSLRKSNNQTTQLVVIILRACPIDGPNFDGPNR